MRHASYCLYGRGPAAVAPDSAGHLLITLRVLPLLQLAYLEVRYQYLAPRDAYQRYLNFIRFKTSSFIRRVPGYHIASYLDISPTTLSLLRSRYGHDLEKKVSYDKEFLDAIGMTGQAPE